MKPLQLLLPITCAAGSFAKPASPKVFETRQSDGPIPIPPSAVIGLQPFQFPTDYNRTASDLNGTPEWWLYCSKTSELVSPTYIDKLVIASLLKTTVDNGTIPNNTGLVWPYLLTEPSSQIYICNHNRLFKFPISVGVFTSVNGLLDEACGRAIAGYVYIDTPWDVAIGRNSTDMHGNPQLQCGGEWSPDSPWAQAR